MWRVFRLFDGLGSSMVSALRRFGYFDVLATSTVLGRTRRMRQDRRAVDREALLPDGRGGRARGAAR